MQLPQTMSHLSQCGSMLPLAVKKTTSPRWARHFFRHRICFSSSSSFPPTVYCQHDDLWPAGQPITAGVFHQTRRLNLRVRGGEFELQSSHCNLEKKSFLFLHYSCIRTTCMHLLSLTCGYCCAMLPVPSVLWDVTVIQRRRKYPEQTYFGWTCLFAVGGFWFSTMLWGVEAQPSGEEGRLKSPVHMEPRICCFLPL